MTGAKRPMARHLTGGRNWVRTSDLFGVNELTPVRDCLPSGVFTLVKLHNSPSRETVADTGKQPPEGHHRPVWDTIWATTL
jgi:hypothetical protein